MTVQSVPSAAVRVPLQTPYGLFDIHAFERSSGHVYVAMVMGDVVDGEDVLVRLHSECLTGDALGSLRCDCGVQLRTGLRMIAAERRGVLVYATDHEGRGIGLINKLRAYVAQDGGADTVDANVALGLPVDSRDYTESAAVLAEIGIRSVRLLSNNPHKVAGLRAAGTVVSSVMPLPTAPHLRNVGYLNTKARRMDHVLPTGVSRTDERPFVAEPSIDAAVDVMALLGEVRAHDDRPYVVLKYAQTLDGRIATSTGDSRWISSEAERVVSHALRAACDAVMVGIGTVLNDDPELTVRMVAGASPRRVVLDSGLRVPAGARILDPGSATTIFTTERSDPTRRSALRELGVRVEVTDEVDGRVSIHEALAMLRKAGIETLLVEGGSEVITALLANGLADRMIVSIAPMVIGTGTEAVRRLGVQTVASAIRLENRTMVPIGDDIIVAGDVIATGSPTHSGAIPPATLLQASGH